MDFSITHSVAVQIATKWTFRHHTWTQYVANQTFGKSLPTLRPRHPFPGSHHHRHRLQVPESEKLQGLIEVTSREELRASPVTQGFNTKKVYLGWTAYKKKAWSMGFDVHFFAFEPRRIASIAEHLFIC